MSTVFSSTPRRFALMLATAAAALLLGASSAWACGNGGYSYAGLSASSHAYGIGATVTPLDGFAVVSGHVAAFVGVGGPSLGPNGTNEWLQVGFSGFPAAGGNNLYYELMLPHRQPTYHEIATNLPVGRSARVAVLEIAGRRDWWRVWVNGAPASPPIHMPASHGRWSPLATAESWDGGTGGGCNGFLYSFNRVSIAAAPGGGWQLLSNGYPIRSASTQFAHSGRSSFLAGAGEIALRRVASVTP